MESFPEEDEHLSYEEFLTNYMITHVPVIIKHIGRRFDAYWDWTEKDDDNGRIPNVKMINEDIGNVSCPVVFDDGTCTTMKGYEYFDKLSKNDFTGYLKDFHYCKEKNISFDELRTSNPKKSLYKLPVYFEDDWFNEFNVRKDDDYRFIYIGPPGSSTPRHIDVMASHSWSVNLCGRKKWTFFVPRRVLQTYKDNRKLELDRLRRASVMAPSGAQMGRRYTVKSSQFYQTVQEPSSEASSEAINENESGRKIRSDEELESVDSYSDSSSEDTSEDYHTINGHSSTYTSRLSSGHESSSTSISSTSTSSSTSEESSETKEKESLSCSSSYNSSSSSSSSSSTQIERNFVETEEDSIKNENRQTNEKNTEKNLSDPSSCSNRNKKSCLSSNGDSDDDVKHSVYSRVLSKSSTNTKDLNNETEISGVPTSKSSSSSSSQHNSLSTSISSPSQKNSSSSSSSTSSSSSSSESSSSTEEDDDAMTDLLKLEIVQEAGDAIFVPSELEHSVENLDFCISINHNWCNASNLSRVITLAKNDWAHALSLMDLEEFDGNMEDRYSMVSKVVRANGGFTILEVGSWLSRVVVEVKYRQPLCDKYSPSGSCSCQLCVFHMKSITSAIEESKAVLDALKKILLLSYDARERQQKLLTFNNKNCDSRARVVSNTWEEKEWFSDVRDVLTKLENALCTENNFDPIYTQTWIVD